jgi:hypothetical protein
MLKRLLLASVVLLPIGAQAANNIYPRPGESKSEYEARLAEQERQARSRPMTQGECLLAGATEYRRRTGIHPDAAMPLSEVSKLLESCIPPPNSGYVTDPALLKQLGTPYVSGGYHANSG